MPTYYTPPQSPTRTSPPSLSRSTSYSSSNRSSTRNDPHSSKKSKPSSSSSSSSAAAAHKAKDEARAHGVPYLFLSSIAAASLLAHRYWPKGYPHGDKEDWELSEYGLRARERKLAERAARRDSREFGGEVVGRRRSRGYDGYDEGRGRGDYRGEGRRKTEGDRYHRPWGEDAVYYKRRSRSGDRRLSRREEEMDRSDLYGRDTTRSTGRDRPWSGESRHRYDSEPLGYPLASTPTSSRSSTGGGSRYLVDRGSSSAGHGLSQRRYYDDYPSDVVYFYRDPPMRSRRASFDVDGGRRYDWYYR